MRTGCSLTAGKDRQLQPKDMNEKPQTQLVKPSALDLMASQFNVDRAKLWATLKETVFAGANDSELMALVVVAGQYGLNPFTREIHAFKNKAGGIVPVVGIDGWLRIMNSRPEFDGIEYQFAGEGDDLECTATIHVKGRSHPVRVTEYLAECFRPTDPWKTAPRRMLRHKATIQCARVAFGFSGIVDHDEAEMIQARVDSVETVTTKIRPEEAPALHQPEPQGPPPQPATESPQTRLAALVIGAGQNFDTWAAWAGQKLAGIHGKELANVDSFDTIPDSLAERCIRGSRQMLAEMGGGK